MCGVYLWENRQRKKSHDRMDDESERVVRRRAGRGTAQDLVAAEFVLVFPRLLHDAPDARPARVPEDQPPAGGLLDAEEVQLLPQQPVVALLRFLQATLVLRELPVLLPRLRHQSKRGSPGPKGTGKRHGGATVP